MFYFFLLIFPFCYWLLLLSLNNQNGKIVRLTSTVLMKDPVVLIISIIRVVNYFVGLKYRRGFFMTK